MDILYLLIPMSAVLVLGILAVFASALQGGQFEDLDQQAERILAGDEPVIDRHQVPRDTSQEESASRDGCE